MSTEPRLARFSEIPVFRTARIRSLSSPGIWLVIKKCEFINEGTIVTENGTTSFYGSSMITLKAESSDGKRELGENNLDEILKHIQCNPLLNLQLTRMARLEATRRIGSASLGTAYYTFSANRKGSTIEINIDVEIHNLEQAASR
ncbi:MAG: hypothetical protein ABIJ56_07875 [Pseudomonadota bacterium]